MSKKGYYTIVFLFRLFIFRSVGILLLCIALSLVLSSLETILFFSLSPFLSFFPSIHFVRFFFYISKSRSYGAFVQAMLENDPARLLSLLPRGGASINKPKLEWKVFKYHSQIFGLVLKTHPTQRNECGFSILAQQNGRSICDPIAKQSCALTFTITVLIIYRWVCKMNSFIFLCYCFNATNVLFLRKSFILLLSIC